MQSMLWCQGRVMHAAWGMVRRCARALASQPKASLLLLLLLGR